MRERWEGEGLWEQVADPCFPSQPSQHARSSSSLTSTSTSSSALPALVHSRAHSSNSSHSSSSHSRTHSNSSTFSFNHSRDHSGSSTYSSCASASSLPPSPTLSSDPFSSTAGSVSSSPKKTQRRSEEVCPLDGLNAYFWAVRLSRVEEDTASRSASSSPRQSSPQSSPLPSEPRQFVPQSSPHSSPQHSLPRRTSTFNHSRRRDPTPVEFDFEIAYTPTGSSTFTPLSIPTSPSSAHSGESTLSVHSPTFPSEDLDTELEELSEYFSHPAPRNQVFPSWPHKETAGALRVGEQRRVVDSGRNALRERRVEYDWI